ncbi:MAG: hypothetical protein J7494_01480 [Sphingobium sp.]|nr:hypothetical protein [Sphingobium sp.]
MTDSAVGQEKPGHVVLFAAPVKPGEIIVHGLFWKCADRRCAAVLSNSRPVVVCMAMARALGPITAFDTDGAPLKTEDLARCNMPRGERQIASAP